MDAFNWLQYLNNYSDLRAAGIKDQQGAYRHYLKYGKKEGRIDQVIPNDNNKLANFGIIINSCKKFYNLYIPRILNQLLLNNFPVDNIVVVVGQSDKNEDSQYNGIKIINVTYTGLNFSSMIHMVENIDFYLNKNLKTWLVLPDTIEVTKNFYNLISPYVNKMEEQDSGEITEYHVFSSITTLSPTPMPNAPPEAPSPMMIQITGTFKRIIS